MSLDIRHVTKWFSELKALDDVSISIANGSLVCFLGPSGCGKTTLLRVIAGLERQDQGELALNGEDLSLVPARSRNFGVVFQSYSLFPNMTVAANVAYGLECRNWTKNRVSQRVEEILSLVHLNDQAAKLPHQLSGGQQQRIALARALAPNPAVLLLDEPLSALDAKVREELRVEIRMLQKRLNITTIMVTHDQEEALTMADKIVVMQNGKVMQSGSPMELYRKPANRFVAEFIGLMNIVPGDVGIPTPEDPGPAHTLPKIVGIRPEDIRLLDEHVTQSHPQAVIDQIVRLGNLTRVTLRLPENGAAHSSGQPGEQLNKIKPVFSGNGRRDNGFVRLVAEIQGLGEDLEVGMARSIAVAPESVRVLEWQ